MNKFTKKQKVYVDSGSGSVWRATVVACKSDTVIVDIKIVDGTTMSNIPYRIGQILSESELTPDHQVSELTRF